MSLFIIGGKEACPETQSLKSRVDAKPAGYLTVVNPVKYVSLLGQLKLPQTQQDHLEMRWNECWWVLFSMCELDLIGHGISQIIV